MALLLTFGFYTTAGRSQTTDPSATNAPGSAVTPPRQVKPLPDGEAEAKPASPPPTQAPPAVAVALPPIPSALRAGLGDALKDQADRVATWYAERNFAPAWDDAMASGLINFVRGLKAHGLEPFLFRIAEIETAWQLKPDNDTSYAARDLLTTRLAFRVINTLANGFVDPALLHPKWETLPKRIADPFALIDRALVLTPEELPPMFERALPRDPRYRQLVEKLARYRDIAARGGWRALPDLGEPLKQGAVWQGVGLLRARLRAEGDLPAEASRIVPSNYDAETSAAVEAFQFRHGIDPDGVIGPMTLTELNSPVTHRINALLVNLERLRWMSAIDSSGAYVEVNIAESALRMFRAGQRVGTMRVIVGKQGEHQTPLFHGSIRYLIFRPYWNVPISIARDEIGPVAAEDPDYLVRNNYEIVPSFGVSASAALPIHAGTIAAMREGRLSLRQGTGPKNALGLVKFIFPNDSSVYLHDTPNRNLFSRTDRDFSHGCVRVSSPALLAEFALSQNGDWSVTRIDGALNDSDRPNRQVNVATPIPVYLVYWTATILDDGRVRFDQDIYGHDRALRAQLGLGATARPTAGGAGGPAAATADADSSE